MFEYDILLGINTTEKTNTYLNVSRDRSGPLWPTVLYTTVIFIHFLTFVFLVFCDSFCFFCTVSAQNSFFSLCIFSFSFERLY